MAHPEDSEVPEITEELANAETKAPEPKLTLTPAEREAKRKERDKLVEQYLPFATYIVRKVSKTISGAVDFEDLLSYAKVGLIEAAERFDARFKVDFRTFAFYRIRGAIYDGLRTTGWLSRTQFAKHQFEEASNNYLKSMNDRAAAGGAKTHESPEGEMQDCIFNLASVYIMSLDAAEGLQVKDNDAEGADTRCEITQTRDKVRTAIEKLPPKEKQLIKLYYYGGMTLDEAGTSLGLSRSWTSRLHARALEQLQKIIRENADLEELESDASSRTETTGKARAKAKAAEKAKTERKPAPKKPVADEAREEFPARIEGVVGTRC